LILVGRCYTDGRVLRIARFWYVPCVFRVDRWQTKPEDFVSWCQAVFRKTKALLQRQPNSYYRTPIKEWFGKQAWAEVSVGRLKAVPN
jgi:hypothetical protein